MSKHASKLPRRSGVCPVCQSTFSYHGVLRRRIFCSARCRSAQHNRAVAERRRKVGGVTACTYCGAPATGRDHVIPRSALRMLAEVGLSKVEVTVPCCSDCNSRLGAIRIWTVSGRRRYVRAALRRKHAKLLAMPDWTHDELMELGPGLRTAVVCGLADRDVVRARLAYQP